MPDIVFAADGFAEVAAWLGARGITDVLVLCSPNRRYVDRLVGVRVEIFDGAKVHVPFEVVDEAASHMPKPIVAIGGGSAIGLGKALRLQHSVPFVAMPTTYAGSEMTTMYGITRGADKQTGRDPRVAPDLVVYDCALACDLPIVLSVQSLLNAAAHVASIAGDRALIDNVLVAIDGVLAHPRDIAAREAAARAANACAIAFEHGKPGAQHALAHLLGGALRIDHAPIHATLLPHFLAHRGDLELARRIYDTLVRAGAPTALPGDPAIVHAALATRPELPGSIALAALAGQRP